MYIYFQKYQGTGNDFIMLDNLNGQYDELSLEQVRLLCDRRFGIGADGLIRINRSQSSSFEVDYFNADGSKSFCGNGARCSVEFAKGLGFKGPVFDFTAIDGEHSAQISSGLIVLDMLDVERIERTGSDYVLDTGSPHFIRFVDDLSDADVIKTGRDIRYSELYREKGINVNLVEVKGPNELSVLTYERGVEDETLSCGTGVTASALAYSHREGFVGEQLVKVHVKGGELQVAFHAKGNGVFTGVQLIGPAVHVFSGEINV